MGNGSVIKLPLMGRRNRLPELPDQPQGTSYGVIMGACEQPQGSLGYVVELLHGNQAQLLGCITTDGFVFPTDHPLIDRPSAKGGAALAIAEHQDGTGGGIYVRIDGDMRRVGSYSGEAQGTMREDDPTTWNGGRSLRFRDFMATLFLRYCVLSPTEARTRAAAQNESDASQGTIDMTFGTLDEPVTIFQGFDTTSLPDAIDALLFRVGEKRSPCGIERFAHRVLRTIDLERLRGITEHGEITLARIQRGGYFYINCDRSSLSEEDVLFLLGVEAALNRVSRVLDAVGSSVAPLSISPSEEACSAIDLHNLRGIASCAETLLDTMGAKNPWSAPGTIACEPGGEWDIRTRMADRCEALNLTLHLEYGMRFDATLGELGVRFIPPTEHGMPRSYFREEGAAWYEPDEDERRCMATECEARMAIALAAAAFSTGLSIKTCLVEASATSTRPANAWKFERASFLATIIPQLDHFTESPLWRRTVSHAIAPFATFERLGENEGDPRLVKPRDDGRALPQRLRDLLLADTPRDLEVMELPDEPRLARVRELNELALTDREAAAEGLVRLIEELEADCVVQELMADVPTESQYSENYLARMLLGLRAEDPALRINRVPDALFNAQHTVTELLAQAELFDRALPEARKLLDMASTSSASHFSLINVLARLERWDELAEVARHGLSVAYERDTIAYYFYRLAFAYWNLGDRDLALACYRMVPRGEGVSDVAHEEMHALMAQMGLHDEPTIEEAHAALEAAGIEAPPTQRVSALIADAAVLLTDNGFFFLAARCVFEMWRIMGRDELGVVRRSLSG